MTVTMTMEEYLDMKAKAENYDDLFSSAQNVIANCKKFPHNNDCYNYVRWLSEGDVDCIVGQYGASLVE